MNNVTAILCADLHLRDDQPICRKDDFFKAMIRKMNWLRCLQHELQCPIICAGDIFDKWKGSPFLLSQVLRWFPDNVIAIPGQHDLPNHDINAINKSSLYVLHRAKRISLFKKYSNDEMRIASNAGSENYSTVKVFGFPFGMEIKKFPIIRCTRSVAMCHTLVCQSKDRLMMKLGAVDSKALLRKLDNIDLIVTGDNHKPFIERLDGRLLVNCGSMMRIEADQVDYKPCVYLWDRNKNEVEAVSIPIEEGVVSRDHLKTNAKELFEHQLEVYIERLKKKVEIGLSFEKNLTKFFVENSTVMGVKKLIRKAMEE